jgi:tetratricopeptide (TPR) repeat protein
MKKQTKNRENKSSRPNDRKGEEELAELKAAQESINEAVAEYPEALEHYKMYRENENRILTKLCVLETGGEKETLQTTEFVVPILQLRDDEVKDSDTGELEIASIPLESIRYDVSQIVESDTSSEKKIVLLKQIEEIKYKPLVRALAYKKTPEELNHLVTLLKDLGYMAQKLGEISADLKYYTDAAIFYQYAITIIQEKTKPVDSVAKIKDIYTELKDIKDRMLNLSSISSHNKTVGLEKEIKKNINIVKNLREGKNKKLEKIDKLKDSEYIKQTKELFKEISNSIKGFVAKLFEDSEKEIGKPPCKYTVMGLGSLALNQATPYSDLEFAILTESDKYKDDMNLRVRAYFKNLTHLVHFKIINLGETIIPNSRYDVDLSHLVHRGINFDLGGKTPLGRIDKDKKNKAGEEYDLVGTIGKILEYMVNKDNIWGKTDKSLPYIVENVSYIHGAEDLVEEYQTKVHKFLVPPGKVIKKLPLKCTERAVEILKNGIIEINYSTVINPLVTKIPGDLEKLQPFALHEGELFNVKQEIYRLPDRLIYNLGMLYGIKGESAWDIVDKLAEHNVLNKESAENLKFAISFATSLRLKIYLHYHAQRDDMSLFPLTKKTGDSEAKEIFHLNEVDLSEDGVLFKFYYASLPLHNQLKKFCELYQRSSDKTLDKSFFLLDKFNLADDISKGFVCHRLCQYIKAKDYLIKALETKKYRDDLMVRHELAIIHQKLDEDDKALEQFQYIRRNAKIEDVIYIYASINLAQTHQSIGKYDEAIRVIEHVYQLIRPFYGKDPKIDTSIFLPCLNVLGLIYDNRGLEYVKEEDHKEALSYYQKALSIKKHESILNNMSRAYIHLKDFKKATELAEEALKLREDKAAEEPTQGLMASYNVLAKCYLLRGDENDAVKAKTLYLKSIKISKKVINLNEEAAAYSGLGHYYYLNKEYNEAIRYFKQAELILNTIKVKDHGDFGALYHNMGIAYNDNLDYPNAVLYHKKALEARQNKHYSKEHPEIIESGSMLDNACKKMKKSDEVSTSDKEKMASFFLNFYSAAHGISKEEMISINTSSPDTTDLTGEVEVWKLECGPYFKSFIDDIK